jgi:hypothetical protein
MEVDTPETGTHTIHYFDAVPYLDEPILGESEAPDDLTKCTSTLMDDEDEDIVVKVKFRYRAEDMTEGQDVLVMLGVDGLAEMLFWECDQDG